MRPLHPTHRLPRIIEFEPNKYLCATRARTIVVFERARYEILGKRSADKQREGSSLEQCALIAKGYCLDPSQSLGSGKLYQRKLFRRELQNFRSAENIIQPPLEYRFRKETILRGVSRTAQLAPNDGRFESAPASFIIAREPRRNKPLMLGATDVIGRQDICVGGAKVGMVIDALRNAHAKGVRVIERKRPAHGFTTKSGSFDESAPRADADAENGRNIVEPILKVVTEG